MKRRTLLTPLWAAPLAAALPLVARAAPTFIHLGSGATAGLYYPTAVDMAAIANDADPSLRVYVEVTAASVENCRRIGAGTLQMGITQNNIAFYAQRGQGLAAFDGQPVKDLRGVAVLYPEAIQILVRRDIGVDSIAALRGRRVYVGAAGSGTEEDAVNILAAHGLALADLRVAVRGNAGDAVNLLRDGLIDAMFYTVGLGAPAVADAVASGQADLLAIAPEQIAALHARFPFYDVLTIPADTYARIRHPVTTITLQAMLAASAALPPAAVQAFMQAVFSTQLRRFLNNPRNPNLRKYFAVDTALRGMPIPLHAGAVAFYRAHGVTVPEALLAPA